MTLSFLFFKNNRRLIVFSLIGGIVALLGSILLYFFIDICQIEDNTGYFLQTFISLQINFNLNDFITWRDRRKNYNYWNRWIKFHVARFLTILICQLFFYLMVNSGMHYMIAFLFNIAFGMVINYISSNKFVFR